MRDDEYLSRCDVLYADATTVEDLERKYEGYTPGTIVQILRLNNDKRLSAENESKREKRTGKVIEYSPKGLLIEVFCKGESNYRIYVSKADLLINDVVLRPKKI